MLEDLSSRICKLIATHKLPFTPRNLNNENNKWIARSALQKAIRRGEVNVALKAAGFLYYADQDYLFNGLAIIAIEDIGIGDFEVCTITHQLLMKTVRKNYEPLPLISALVHRMCLTQKSRAFCEISLGADLAEYRRLQELQLMSTTDLVTLTLAPLAMDKFNILTLVDSYFGFITLRGKAYSIRNGRRHKDDEGLSKVYSFLEQHISPLQLEATIECNNRSKDSMGLACGTMAMLCVWMEARNEKVDIINDDLGTSDRVYNGLPIAALDMHTHIGKKALKAFHTRLMKIDNKFTMIPRNVVVNALGSAVFIVEGGQEQKRMMNRYLSDIKEFQDTNFAAGYGIPVKMIEHVVKTVRDQLPLLNECRRWAMKVES